MINLYLKIISPVLIKFLSIDQENLTIFQPPLQVVTLIIRTLKRRLAAKNIWKSVKVQIIAELHFHENGGKGKPETCIDTDFIELLPNLLIRQPLFSSCDIILIHGSSCNMQIWVLR